MHSRKDLEQLYQHVGIERSTTMNLHDISHSKNEEEMSWKYMVQSNFSDNVVTFLLIPSHSVYSSFQEYIQQHVLSTTTTTSCLDSIPHHESSDTPLQQLPPIFLEFFTIPSSSWTYFMDPSLYPTYSSLQELCHIYPMEQYNLVILEHVKYGLTMTLSNSGWNPCLSYVLCYRQSCSSKETTNPIWKYIPILGRPSKEQPPRIILESYVCPIPSLWKQSCSSNHLLQTISSASYHWKDSYHAMDKKMVPFTTTTHATSFSISMFHDKTLSIVIILVHNWFVIGIITTTSQPWMISLRPTPISLVSYVPPTSKITILHHANHVIHDSKMISMSSSIQSQYHQYQGFSQFLQPKLQEFLSTKPILKSHQGLWNQYHQQFPSTKITLSTYSWLLTWLRRWNSMFQWVLFVPSLPYKKTTMNMSLMFLDMDGKLHIPCLFPWKPMDMEMSCFVQFTQQLLSTSNHHSSDKSDHSFEM